MTQLSRDVHLNPVLSWPDTKYLSACERPLQSILDNLVYEGVTVSWEIVEWINILKYREKFPNVRQNMARILSGIWQFCSNLVLFLLSQSVVPWGMENYFRCPSIGKMFGSTAAHYEGAHYTVSSIVPLLCLFRLQMLSALYFRSSSLRLSYRVAFHKAERISGTYLRY
jgi:hypothetical protein